MYGGRLFSDYVPVHESDLARMCFCPVEKIRHDLVYLNKLSIVDYRPLPPGATVVFVCERRKLGSWFLSPQNYAFRKDNARRKLDAVLSYAEEKHLCRNRYLLQYFGEDDTFECGRCDICLEKKKRGLRTSELKSLKERVGSVLRKEEGISCKEFLQAFPEEEESSLMELWDYLMGEGYLEKVGPLRFRWKV